MKLRNKLIISLSISFFLILLFNLRIFATTGIITEITVNVREKPSTNSKKVMYVTQDNKVEVLEKDGDWYKIKYNNKIGYVSSKYIQVNDSEVTSNESNSEKNTDDTIIKEEKDNTENIDIKLYIKSGTDARIIPNISASIIYTADTDISIDVVEKVGNWTYVSINGMQCWIKSDKVLEQGKEISEDSDNEKEAKKNEEENISQNKTDKKSYVQYTTVNLRKKASTGSEIVAKLKLNDEVTIIEEVNSVWYKVEFDGKTGYISKDLLSDKKQEQNDNLEKEETSSRSSDTTSREDEKEKISQENNSNKTTISSVEKKDTVTGEEIVEYAKQYLGYKYVYGGASPSTGFDCSGLTYYVYKHFGYTLSRSSTAQANNGVKVEKSDLQPGDLVIYKNNSLTKIGHVGIYIGNNKMIHASEPGVGVIITDIDSKAHKYPQRYVMGRRIIK